MSHKSATAIEFDEQIIGDSPFQEVLNQVRIVAPTNSVTLIQGETGTGKEVIARAIHEQSSRRQGPFVKQLAFSILILCSALTPVIQGGSRMRLRS